MRVILGDEAESGELVFPKHQWNLPAEPCRGILPVFSGGSLLGRFERVRRCQLSERLDLKIFCLRPRGGAGRRVRELEHPPAARNAALPSIERTWRDVLLTSKASVPLVSFPQKC